MQSPDHPSLRFVEAEGFTTGRPDGKPLWIVVHDMEASETATRAENTALYFANPGDGRNVSSHYCWDNNSGVQCVLLRDSAWTVGNRPGNNRGINHEYAGFAGQGRGGWLDPYSRAMFAQSAPYIRADAKRYGIPLERRTVAELKAWKPGITSHNDLRQAFGGTTHTDPGPNFPWDVYLEIIRGTPVSPPVLPKEYDMAFMFRVQPLQEVWKSNGIERSHVVDTATRDALLACGLKLTTLTPPTGVEPAGFVEQVGGPIAAASGGPVSGPVDLTEAAISAVAEANADTLAARLTA
jgi:N-acetyl-anhydromuramyl-L-alanine amidase AmpD